MFDVICEILQIFGLVEGNELKAAGSELNSYLRIKNDSYGFNRWNFYNNTKIT